MKRNAFFIFLIRTNTILFILLFLLVFHAFSYVTFLLPEEASIGSNLLTSPFRKVIIGIILGPLAETLLFQTLIIMIICKFVKRPRYSLYLSVFLSASLFALNHNYNIYYIGYTFATGIILAFAYYIGRYKRFSPTLTVFFIHALYNALVIYT